MYAFLIDLKDGIQKNLTRFADDPKLRGLVNALKEKNRIQNNPTRQ